MPSSEHNGSELQSQNWKEMTRTTTILRCENLYFWILTINVDGSELEFTNGVWSVWRLRLIVILS